MQHSDDKANDQDDWGKRNGKEKETDEPASDKTEHIGQIHCHVHLSEFQSRAGRLGLLACYPRNLAREAKKGKFSESLLYIF